MDITIDTKILKAQRGAVPTFTSTCYTHNFFKQFLRTSRAPLFFFNSTVGISTNFQFTYISCI